MADLDLNARQDEPYHGVFEWIGEDESLIPLPATGDLRMHAKAAIEDRRVRLDASQYLTRDGATAIVLDLPPQVTVGLPAVLFYDVWIGDTQIAEGRLLTDQSVTKRVHA